jgi:hypothetical protein
MESIGKHKNPVFKRYDNYYNAVSAMLELGGEGDDSALPAMDAADFTEPALPKLGTGLPSPIEDDPMEGPSGLTYTDQVSMGLDAPFYLALTLRRQRAQL